MSEEVKTEPTIEAVEAKVQALEAEKERQIKEKENALKVAESMTKLENLNVKLTKDLETLKEEQKHIKDSVEKDIQERKIIFDVSKVNEPVEGKKNEKFSYARLIKAIAFKDWSIAPYERKALGEGTGSAGGFLVPEEYVTEIRERIMAQSVIRSLGVTTYPMATDTLNVPRITGGATHYWVAENADITSTDPTFGQLVLSAKLLAALLKLSNQLINDSSPSAEAAVRRDTAKVIALGEDFAFIQGTGTGNQPTGILNTSGIASVSLGANGATPTFDNVYDTLYEVEFANGMASGWVMHPRTKNTMRKIKDSQNNYIYNVAPSMKEPDTLVGLPVKLTTQVPINLTVGSNTDNSYVLCGQWDEAVIGERAGIEFATDQSGSAFVAYQTWIRAIERIDFGLRTPGVFCKMVGVRA